MNPRQDETERGWDASPERRRAEQEYHAAQERERTVNFKAFLMSVGVILAPFLALIFGIDAALFVLALAMGFVTWLTWAGANHVAASQRTKLRAAAVFNGGLALLVLVLLILRQFA